jgi:hypothetical protein
MFLVGWRSVTISRRLLAELRGLVLCGMFLRRFANLAASLGQAFFALLTASIAGRASPWRTHAVRPYWPPPRRRAADVFAGIFLLILLMVLWRVL